MSFSLTPKQLSTVSELQDASRILQTPGMPRVQVQQAEEIFKSFRRLEKPYAFCKYLLESGQDHMIVFQAVSTLKDAIIREWSVMPPQELTQLRTYLLQYVIRKMQHEAIIFAVREKLIQLIALMVKREAIDDNGEKKTVFLKHVYKLVSNGEPHEKVVGSSLICAILQEFAVMTKSSDIGLPFATHFSAKKDFEQQDLLEMFRFTLKMLTELERMPHPYSEHQESLYDSCLQSAESILTWTFVSNFNLPRKVQSAYETDSTFTFRPPTSWKDSVLKPDILQLFFSIYYRLHPRYPGLIHRVSACLLQLATLNRFFVTDEPASLEFVRCFVQGWLYLSSNPMAMTSTEARSLASIITRLSLFFSSALLSRLKEEIYVVLFERMSSMTQVMILKACEEDASGGDDTKYMDTMETLLGAWLTVLLEPSMQQSNFLECLCTPIFEKYLICHLGPPQGKRLMRDEEELGTIEDPDREKYRSQLCHIALMGRRFASHCIPLLVACFEERLPALQSFLCGPGIDEGLGMETTIPPVTTQMTSMFEDLHWLLLIAGHVLCNSTDDGSVEAVVPADINDYSMALSKQENAPPIFPVPFAEKFRGSLVAGSPGVSATSDPVVRLIFDCLALSEILRNAELAGRSCVLSPELVSTSYWFLDRFGKAYLALNEATHTMDLPLTFSTAFGLDSPGAKWALEFLFQNACSSLNVWVAEKDLLSLVTGMLISLARDRRKSMVMSEMPEFWTLVQLQVSPQFRQLPSETVRALMTYFVLTSTNGGLEETVEVNLKKVFGYMIQQFEILSNENLSAMANNEVARAHLLYIIDLFAGVVSGGALHTADILYRQVVPALRLCVERVLVTLNNDQQVVDGILSLMNCSVSSLISYLNKNLAEDMYRLSLSTIATYARCNVGKRTRQSAGEEDEGAFNDVAVLIELLNSLLSREYIDLSPDPYTGFIPDPQQNLTAAQVALEGMNILMPLMTHDLLRCPWLCKAFYQLLTFISVISAETFANLTPDKQGMFYNVVVTGLTAFDAEIMKSCLETTTVLAGYVYEKPDSSLKGMVSGFVKVILELTMSESVRSENTVHLGTCLFALICAYLDEFREKAKILVEKVRGEDAERGERLERSFVKLFDGVEPRYEHPERIKFAANFERFLIEAQSVFLIM
ncbi:unnamed protein product [Notodromas monacha]|uniref:Exportin-4 n=1 Tax=Notodromas monacha TaxID=399045 RepID=A0A7R9BPV5_9CRUS|nr:unnamed protein product [Notodromas monacha]CAG0917966.1 unnamed protein product [Notodromas monacha]